MTKKPLPDSITVEVEIDLEAPEDVAVPVSIDGAKAVAYVGVDLDPEQIIRYQLARWRQERAEGLRNGRANGPRAGRPAKKRAAADKWLGENIGKARRLALRHTRRGLARVLLALMPARNRPGETVMLEALAALLGPAK